jgi:hypothetical protein
MRQKPPGWFEELLIRLGARAAAPIVTGTASYVGGRLAERRRTRKKLGFAMDEQIEMYPMKSQAQRRFLHAVHPDIAEEFESKTPAGKKLPEHAKKKKKYELPLGSRLKWGAKRWAKRAALAGGGVLGGAAYVKAKQAKKEYDTLRSAGFTPQEASEIATAGVLGKYSLNYQSPSINPIRTGLGQVWGGLESGYETTAPRVQEWLKKPTTRRLALAAAGGGYYLGRRKKKREGYSLSYQAPGAAVPSILGGIKELWDGLKSGYETAAPRVQEWLKKPTTRRLALAAAGGGYYLGRRKKRESEGYSLYQQYKNDPDLMRTIAARDGVELDVQRYAIQDVLTSWQLGYKHGEEEAQGIRPAPGALRLAALMKLHGESYVLGRQKALTEAGMHGGTRQSESFLETLVESVDRLLGGETKNAEASQTKAGA